MKRFSARSFFVIALGVVSLTLIANIPCIAAADSRADETVAKKIRTTKGRLPRYYAHVVTDKQREEIYRIQEEYKPKIAEIKAQLAKLTRERDEKIAAVLTDEQKKKVADAAARPTTSKEAKPAEAPSANGEK